ncbi:MAG: polyamine aminopropyltransferase [Candidatus Aminicenantales bacterium]
MMFTKGGQSPFFHVIILAMMEEGLYFFEFFTENMVKGIRVGELLYQGKTRYQFIQIFSNAFLGKVLFLDKKIQSAQIDEHIYHESLVHPGLMAHPNPEEVLIIGGGEGATLREVLRHKPVRNVTMVDIDEELVRLCQKHLPEWSEGAFTHPKTQMIFEDARHFVEKGEEKYDVIISDLTEPLKEGPSLYLFTREFFEHVFHGLKEDGLFVLQAGSTDPLYHEFFASCARTLSDVFPLVRPYWSFIFSFGLPWGFVVASKKEDPLELDEKKIMQRLKERGIRNLKYYHPPLHKGFFALPLYLTEGMKKGRVLTDSDPFVWKL